MFYLAGRAAFYQPGAYPADAEQNDEAVNTDIEDRLAKDPSQRPTDWA